MGLTISIQARAVWLLMLTCAYDYGDHVEDPEAIRQRLGIMWPDFIGSAAFGRRVLVLDQDVVL